ncbi:7TM-DISM domain-containing protein [Algoriphagus sp. AK58]|uniref:sensor histidine kinase n=1 Tax=Algoriphagus sp. AK58 TaxID=1406877 RepID=UPI00164FCF19|nr:hypothetical protein [Algoriphagus sp. AK58]
MSPFFSLAVRVVSWVSAFPILFLLFSLNPSEEKSTSIPFWVFTDEGQSVSEAWKDIPEEYITQGRFNPGIQLHSWWVKTVVKNESSAKDRLFLILNNPHINRIEVYFNGSQEPQWITGDRFPFDSRPYSSRDFVFPFELNPDEQVTVLMKLDKRGETFHIDPELLPENDFAERRRTEHIMMGLVGGWMLLVVVFTLFFWSELRDRSAFYYALYILLVFLWIFAHWGMAYQFLWPEAVTWVGKSRPILNLASFIFLLLTIINFFPPTGIWRPFELAFRIMIWTNTALLLAFLVIPEEVPSPEVVAFFLKVVLILSAVQVLIVVSYLIVQYKAKTPFAGFYLSGIAFLMVFSLLIYLDQATGAVLLSHTLLNFGSAFGLMGETALISFAFMRQASLEKKEKEKLAVKILTREKEIADQIILAQEEERNRLGRDLHDGLLGFLGSAHLKVQTLVDKFPYPELLELKNQLNEGIRETRVLSHDLTPPLLEEFGLEQSLRNKLVELEQSGAFKTSLFAKLHFDVSKSIQVTVYRICMELIHNALKHSKAQELHISLETTPDELILMVEDDGIGFDPEAKKKGIGLKNIENRVNYLKGTLQIDSKSAGTSILILIPLSPNPNE